MITIAIWSGPAEKQVQTVQTKTCQLSHPQVLERVYNPSKERNRDFQDYLFHPG